MIQTVHVPISHEEAKEIFNSKSGIIFSGTHIFAAEFYCTPGTVPGNFCLHSDLAIDAFNVKQWYRISLRDLIILRGFYPDPFSMEKLIKLQKDLKDDSINISDLVQHCIDGHYSYYQLKQECIYEPSRIWANYFREKPHQKRVGRIISLKI